MRTYIPGIPNNNLASRLMTCSLQNLSWGGSVSRVLAAALQAVEPGAAVKRWMVRKGNTLWVSGREYPLHNYRKVQIVGIGKAAVPMGIAAVEILGPFFSEGVLLTKDGYGTNLTGHKDLSGLLILEAGHPIPDERCLKGAQRITTLINGSSEDDLVICLLSGGGSALLCAPVEGISLEDLQVITSLLLACGASINETNTVRKHLETLKGGGMARLAAPASIITLVLSDVINDPLDVIASGPWVPDPSTYVDAIQVLEKYGLCSKVPTSVIDHLRSGLHGDIPETPKPGEKCFERVIHAIVGSNRLASEAAVEQARAEKFSAMLLTTSLQGEASQSGRMLGQIAREMFNKGKPISRPGCLIAGGETTVTIRGNGVGGRNQELALGSVETLAGLKEVVMVTLATDGGDGPTDAAGAVVTGDTLDRAQKLGLSPADHLARNDAYPFFEALSDHIKTGPTQTNVNDLALLFIK